MDSRRVGEDVAEALGYVKPQNAISAHVDDEDKTTALIQGTGSAYKRYVVLVSEPGGCSVIISSKLPQTKVFKRGHLRSKHPHAEDGALKQCVTKPFEISTNRSVTMLMRRMTVFQNSGNTRLEIRNLGLNLVSEPRL